MVKATQLMPPLNTSGNIAERLWANRGTRESVNLLSPRRDSTEFTHQVTERFLNDIAERNPARRAHRVNERLNTIERAWSANHFSASVDFDYDQFWAGVFNDQNGRLTEACNGNRYTVNDVRRMLAAEDAAYQTRDVQEALTDALTSGHVADMLATIFRFNVIERVEHAPLTLTSLVDRNLRAGPNPERLYKQVNSADTVTDNVAELEETKLQGVTSLPYITPPEPKTKEIAFAITAELATADVGNVIRSQVDNHNNALDLHMEILLNDLAFGLYDTITPGANPFPYLVNGVSLHPFQAAGGPWENDLQPNALDNTYQPFANIGALLEDARDPYSNLPLQKTANGTIVTTTHASQQMALDGLRIIDIERNGASLGATSVTFRNISQASRFNLSVSDVVQADYSRDRLTAWYQTASGGSLAAGAAATAAASTWLYGDLQRGIGIRTQWDRQQLTRSAPNTQEYFMQRIVYMVKWMERTTPFWKDPERVYRNRA